MVADRLILAMTLDEFTHQIVIPSSAVLMIIGGVAFIVLRDRTAAASRDFYRHAPGWYDQPGRRIYQSSRGMLVFGIVMIVFGIYMFVRQFS